MPLSVQGLIGLSADMPTLQKHLGYFFKLSELHQRDQEMPMQAGFLESPLRNFSLVTLACL